MALYRDALVGHRGPDDIQTAEITMITAGRTLRAAHNLDLLAALGRFDRLAPTVPRQGRGRVTTSTASRSSA